MNLLENGTSDLQELFIETAKVLKGHQRRLFVHSNLLMKSSYQSPTRMKALRLSHSLISLTAFIARMKASGVTAAVRCWDWRFQRRLWRGLTAVSPSVVQAKEKAQLLQSSFLKNIRSFPPSRSYAERRNADLDAERRKIAFHAERRTRACDRLPSKTAVVKQLLL